MFRGAENKLRTYIHYLNNTSTYSWQMTVKNEIEYHDRKSHSS